MLNVQGKCAILKALLRISIGQFNRRPGRGHLAEEGDARPPGRPRVQGQVRRVAILRDAHRVLMGLDGHIHSRLHTSQAIDSGMDSSRPCQVATGRRHELKHATQDRSFYRVSY